MALLNVRVNLRGIETFRRRAEERLAEVALESGVQTQQEIVETITQFDTASVGPSSPGEPPHRDKGPLSQSIQLDAERNHWRIGSPLDYAFWLEVGTSIMEARPFLRPALPRWVLLFERFFDDKNKEAA